MVSAVNTWVRRMSSYPGTASVSRGCTSHRGSNHSFTKFTAPLVPQSGCRADSCSNEQNSMVEMHSMPFTNEIRCWLGSCSGNAGSFTVASRVARFPSVECDCWNIFHTWVWIRRLSRMEDTSWEMVCGGCRFSAALNRPFSVWEPYPWVRRGTQVLHPSGAPRGRVCTSHRGAAADHVRGTVGSTRMRAAAV